MLPNTIKKKTSYVLRQCIRFQEEHLPYITSNFWKIASPLTSELTLLTYNLLNETVCWRDVRTRYLCLYSSFSEYLSLLERDKALREDELAVYECLPEGYPSNPLPHRTSTEALEYIASLRQKSQLIKSAIEHCVHE
ncbi:hypothetical protein HYZ97_02125 [Candidatus Pacearchaeota archaeon]|nr:hypothetical protein [Candidatus Pacearchaeota archaeon]